MQEALHVSDDPLTFHHLRMVAEATALTPAFDLPYALVAELALGLPRCLVPALGQTLPLYLHHRARQKATL